MSWRLSACLQVTTIEPLCLSLVQWRSVDLMVEPSPLNCLIWTPDWIPYNKHWTIMWFYLRVGPPRSLKTFCNVFCLLVFVASNCTVLEVKTGTKDGLSSVMETLTFSIERKNCCEKLHQLHWCKREKMPRPPPPPLNNADLQAGVCLQYSVFWVKYGVVDVRSRVEYE